MAAQPETLAPSDSGIDHDGRLWTPGGMIQRNATAADIGRALLHDKDTAGWVFLPRQDNKALEAAAASLDIDRLAMEDLLGDREPMKLDWVGRSMVAVMRTVDFDAASGELTTLPLSVLAGPRALIVLADGTTSAQLCRELDRAEPAVLAQGIPAAIHVVVDSVVGGCTAVLEQMEDQLDDLSEALFSDRPLTKEQQLRAFNLRRSLARLRRVTSPMRDIAADLANAAGRSANTPTAARGEWPENAEQLLGTASVRHFSDVADHAEHTAQGADGLRDVITSMYETNLALADVHLNTVMKKLTGWAAIIAVPTLITGFMGMNVPYPGFQSRTGFVVALLVMVTAVVTLFVTLRRKDWI